MIRGILRAIGRALNYAATNMYAGIVNLLYPGLLDNAVAGAEAAESDVQSDPFEHAADAIADREIVLNDALAWAHARLALGTPSEFPDSLPANIRGWLAARSESELEAIVSASPDHLYVHLFYGVSSPDLPALNSVNAGPMPESYRMAKAPDPCSGSGGLLTHAMRAPAF